MSDMALGTEKTLTRYQPTLREAQGAAIAALAAQDLEMTPFGLQVSEQIVAGEINVDDAVAILVEHHRAQ
jgi:hypothetical protein